MYGIEGAAVFHAQPGQCVDVEKSPVVDLAAGKSPMREPIVLALEQVMQGENSRGVASRAVSPESTLDHVLPVGDRREFGLEGWRLVARGLCGPRYRAANSSSLRPAGCSPAPASNTTFCRISP